MTAPLSFVGVGPGDPELITLKAARLISAADTVAYPAPNGGASAARAIAARHLSDGQRELPLHLPMRIDPEPAQAAYDRAVAGLRAERGAGRSVVVLCEGDPFFYGSAMYLYDRLKDDGGIEVVPGVSSLTACAAVAGRPLAARNDTLSVLPAPLDDAALDGHLALGGGAVILKVGRHLARLRALLRTRGLEDTAVLVEQATRGDQRITPLPELEDDHSPYFSTLLVGREAGR